MTDFSEKVNSLLNRAIATFGQDDVTYQPASGDSFIVKGIFDNKFQEIDPDTGIPISSNQPRLGINLKDFTTLPKIDDTCIIDSLTYKVINVIEDTIGVSTQGGAVLMLKKVV